MDTVLSSIALEIGFGQFLWSLLIIFFMIVFFVVLFQVIVDLLRDHALSGWAKAGWLIFICVLPFLGLLAYMIVRGPHMAERAAAEEARGRRAMDDHIRAAAGATGGPAGEISTANALLKEGVINREEFDTIKRRALGTA